MTFHIDGESETVQTYFEEIRQLYYRVSMKWWKLKNDIKVL